MKEALFGKTLSELQTIALDSGMKKFVAKQIADWLYKKGISAIDDMLNLSIAARNTLKEKYTIGRTAPSSFQESSDGTKKYLFSIHKNEFVETVYIPDGKRATLCVSSQYGCRMGCKFCYTGNMKKYEQLNSTQILNQIQSIAEQSDLSNFVFMGMGEPLDNYDEVLKSLEILTADWAYAYSPRRITVSTIGILPEVDRFIQESDCHLAISLHHPDSNERSKIMPIEKQHPIREVVEHLKNYDLGLQRRLSFEYIMFKGLNDSMQHAKQLLELLDGLRCRVNLIRFHEFPESNLQSSSEEQINEFSDYLNKHGIISTVRTSRGEDILAACGLLANANK